MKLTLSQRVQQIFLGRLFTPEGNRIIVAKSREETASGNYLKRVMSVPATGEKVYEATSSNGKAPIEWFGSNYSFYMLFNS